METLEYRERFRNTIINHIGNSEIWAFHPKFENILVSSLGQVKNTITGHIYTQRKTWQNYSVVSIIPYSDTVVFRSKSQLVHRLVAETFLQYLDYDLYEANHIDGNKNNNSIFNINWLTRKENLKHAIDTGLLKPRFGSDNGRYKYSSSDIKALVELKDQGYTLKQIASLIDVSTNYVSTLLKRRTKCQV